RLSRILVHPAPGAQASVRAALTRLAAGHLNVESTSYEEALFAQAAAASDRSSQLFAAISALVGFLFAFNAMLLTVPQRRRLVVELRRDGYAPDTVIAVLALDALVLGVVGCALGLALGQELSLHVIHTKPAFFSLAFSVGSQRVVAWQTVALAVGGGMLAALVAVLSPLRDIRSRDPLAAARTPARLGHARASGLPALLGLVCLVAATAILLADPRASIPGMVLLVAALLLSLPLVLGATLALAVRLARSITSVVPHVAVMELNAAGARALAIAATGALAVFGSVAIEGARGDLLRGLEGAAREANASSAVWVRPAGSYDLLDTAPFAPTQRARLERLPGVKAVAVYRGGLLDYGDRRVLVIAPPADAETLVPAGQILTGNAHQTQQRLRAGGWVVLSKALASELHVQVGQTITVPSPDPRRFRVAALSTNLGWGPGAIVMNAADYARAWGSEDASAYGITPAPGVSPARVAHEVATALGPQSGLAVQTAAGRVAEQRGLGHEALESLSQIATLIPIVAVLAMAAAMAAMIWQRRPRLAKLKLEGFPRVDLWRTILLESMMLLLVGCVTGALFGLYGQQLADHALASAVSFPVDYSLSAISALGSLALVIVTALAILSLPGYMAASVPAALALQD
ncbi:MAG TPA: FtsX-like permease family protein, partial [Solirubrobacteraceae bacterium]|nr:FtsX-like permease family protein [Solirubrobacteraceae bacterium]